MNSALYWLVLTALATALMWVPYILNSFAVRGIMDTMANPSAESAPLASWANRAKAAHYNAIENLAVIAALVLAAHAGGVAAGPLATAAMVYFFARVAHYIVYLLGIPVARTLCFLVGFGCQIAIALQVLNHLG